MKPEKNETHADADQAEMPGTAAYKHIPAMPDEVLEWLDCRPGGIYVDCTLGGAGHSRAIVEKILPDGLLIGLDQDTAAVANARNVLSPYMNNVRLFHANFTQLPDVLEELGISGVDGILADLGISQYQIEGSGRGFSFSRDEPLDMRMNAEGPVSAGDLVNSLKEAELARIFWEYGEERWSRRIARKIVQVRETRPLTSSLELAQLVRDAVPPPKRTPGSGKAHRIHPATRVFMALRIAVNRELDSVTRLMEIAPDILNPEGRLCILTFHSLEDRIVKHRLRELAQGCNCPKSFPRCVCGRQPVMRNLTRKGIRPSAEEVAANPMARSTTLRAAEKL